MRTPFIALGLIALCLMLCGCGSTGSATGGHQQMERVEVKPTTRDVKVTLPADQLIPLWPILHPAEKGASNVRP